MLSLVQRFIGPLLYAIGFFTCVPPFIQFVLPELSLPLAETSLEAPARFYFYFRHWGLMAACFGGLLIYAGRYAPVRVPAMLAAGVEKLGLVYLIASNWNETSLASLHVAAVFDAVSCTIFALYFLALSREKSRPSTYH